MKTLRIVLVVVLCFAASGTWAQGLYVKVNAGYGFRLGSESTYINETVSTNSSTVEAIALNLGKGLNFGATCGYMFMKNVGAEVEISYLIGGKTESEYKNSVIQQNDLTSIKGKMLGITPSLVITSGLSKIDPYAKVGVIVGLGSITTEMTDDNNGDVYYEKWKLNGGVAVGMKAGVGALFHLNDKIGIFGEVNFVNLSYAPKKGEVKEATLNGVDELSDWTTSEKEIEFVKEVTYSSTTPAPESEPSKVTKMRFPFGSVGVNVGVRIDL